MGAIRSNQLKQRKVFGESGKASRSREENQESQPTYDVQHLVYFNCSLAISLASN